MSKRADDLSKDPFAPENLPEQQSMVEDLTDIAVDKAKSAAGEYMREAPKRAGKRFLWSIVLNLSLAHEDDVDRMLDRLEEGGKVGCYEMMFGSKFSIFGVVKTIIFFTVLAFVVYYLWSQGIIQEMMAQQELIESLQLTATPYR